MKNEILKKKGFTLIELLATLLILAVIAAILFPFIINYIKKAEHSIAIRSLRTMQDAMDRYRIAKYDFSGWAVGDGTRGNVLTNYQQLSEVNASNIITSIADVSSSDRTIRMPAGGLTGKNVVIVSTDSDRDKTSWEVMRYRRATNSLGVDRKGEEVSNADTNTDAFLTPTPDEIDAAFKQ